MSHGGQEEKHGRHVSVDGVTGTRLSKGLSGPLGFVPYRSLEVDLLVNAAKAWEPREEVTATHIK
jgi:hypothetical protein